MNDCRISQGQTTICIIVFLTTLFGACLTNKKIQKRNSNDLIEGQKIFQANCAMCHTPNKDVVGPKMLGVFERLDEKWVIDWVKNSSKMIRNKDAYGVKLFKKWDNIQMPSYDKLSNKEMDKLIIYLKSIN